MRRGALIAAVTAVFVLAGCTVGPDYKRPAVPALPDFRGAVAPADAPSLGDLTWWQMFADETLQALIREAIERNYDVQIAAARILDARSRVTIARSAQFPELNASGGATYGRTEGQLSPIQARETLTASGGLDFSFEIDLWGRFRRGTEAARAELLASADARRFVLTTLVSDLASAYFQMRSLDEELVIARRTFDSREGSRRLVTLRTEGGVAGDIDLRQAEILVATAAQSIPDTERRIEQTENVISVLLGRPPAPVQRGRPLLGQITTAGVPAGLPSSLLERRPDVRQAERQLHAATARVGVAKADYFPRIFLTGAMAGGSLTVNGQSFGPQGLFSVGPAITLPIFTAGRVTAGVRGAEARAQAAMLEYQQVVLQSFRDVADALAEYRKRREARIQQEALTTAARETTRLANLRYTGGVTPYLEVLDSERLLFDAELNLVRIQRDELLAVVRLYKALGGGWQGSDAKARAQ
jgi:outer membrane protein, multidrug efflux system